MLKMEIIRFEAQDVVTASACICVPGSKENCPPELHEICPAGEHLCDLGES